MSIDTERAAQIAKLNDESRCHDFMPTVTSGVLKLGSISGLLLAVKHYDDFTEANDPYGEHDFGSIDWYGQKIFWKIDYYDQDMCNGEDPLSPGCRRILTVMLAEEY